MNTPSSVSFSDLVLMLATMAAVHLGEVGDPVTGETQKNLPAAGQMIDLLAVIQQKSQGNLDPEEVQRIEGCGSLGHGHGSRLPFGRCSSQPSPRRSRSS